MLVQQPAARKAKLVRQVLVQKKKRFIQVLYLGEWWTPISKINSPSCSSL